MLHTLVPCEVSLDVVHDDGSLVSSMPEEIPDARRAVERRRREYTIGRSCARRALRKLAVGDVPILRGAAREPLWPPGIVGSITHCAGYCAAAVAIGARIVTVGIDAESHGRLPPGVLEQVSLPAERARIAAGPPGVHWDCLLLSAKESVFKAYFPLAREWLGFEDADVTFDTDKRTFQARLLAKPVMAGGLPISDFLGRYAIDRERVYTAIVVPTSSG